MSLSRAVGSVSRAIAAPVGVALYAPSVECGDTELECVQGEMGGMGTMAGTATFSNLSPGMYYVIAEAMSLMGGAYTLGITYVP